MFMVNICQHSTFLSCVNHHNQSLVFHSFCPENTFCNGVKTSGISKNLKKIELNYTTKNRIVIHVTIHDTLRWSHNGRDGVSSHQPHDCLLNRLFRRISKKTSKLRVTGLCVGKSPGTGEFPAQMASNAENVSIWWRHHDIYVGKSVAI